MTDPQTPQAATPPEPAPAPVDAHGADLAEALVEEVSIDGMCGVY